MSDENGHAQPVPQPPQGVAVSWQFQRGQLLPDGTYPVKVSMSVAAPAAVSGIEFIIPMSEAQKLLDSLREVVSPLVVAHTIEGNGQ